MPQTHATYPPEFRAEAVRLVRAGGVWGLSKRGQGAGESDVQSFRSLSK
jgi:transposase-like protein